MNLSSVVSSSRVEDQLTCPVCLELFDTPLAFECSHNVCEKCSVTIPTARNEKHCPLCRRSSSLPLKPNLALHHIADQIRRGVLHPTSVSNPPSDTAASSSSTAPAASKCSECQEQTATVVCLQCNAVFCDACSKIIHKLRINASHQLDSVSATPTVIAKRAAQCSEHSEPVKYFCVPCRCVVCTSCLVDGIGSHHGHKCSSIAEGANAVRSDLQALVDKAHVKKEKLQERCRRVETAMDSETKMMSEILPEINLSLEELHRVAEAKFNNITHTVSERFHKNNASLSDLRMHLLSAISSLNKSLIVARVHAVASLSSPASSSSASPSPVDLETVSCFEAIERALAADASDSKQHEVVNKARTVGVTRAVDVRANFNTMIEAIERYLSSAWSLKETPLFKDDIIQEHKAVADEKKLIGTGADGDLVVETEHLLENRVYNFRTVTIQPGATLTVRGWDGSGEGKLRFLCGSLLNLGTIDASGKGYRGGAAPTQGYVGHPGESTSGVKINSIESNQGGGGGGQCNAPHGTAGGGGGGYGTPGQPGAPNTRNGTSRPELSGVGGLAYGDATIVEPTLGSGGGSGHTFSAGGGPEGGRGGGAIFIHADRIENGGLILSNGSDGGSLSINYCSGGGGGSGGSIRLECREFVHRSTSVIEARGGRGGAPGPDNKLSGICSAGGDGGLGRVRITASIQGKPQRCIPDAAP